MDFLKQVAKWLALVLTVDLGMIAFGVSEESAKFGVISALVACGATFLFFYDRMEFIGIMSSLGTPGLDSSNSLSAVVWKFLGYVCLVIALICLIVWR